ncbi:uncharacterized protein PADG_11096 [Paracoccidioides brasiliensis Pb18]|uniref:Uncharacterized protein n=2 Tax=Paracoccidioides brasiliensis TaxID=121759 RepID=A0A0A0HTX9_PARBD|nr:uncharacterized protein PADG_11096 [Paracoccidioides brasiliensis Pb18]KGM92644.1 hypothetical protein PADG_11096 [Paracoccidioides brasiliensis Pb18]ODH13174.1 hypothetical protein ACO22_07526 [Paracoccidioides brasiliensis]
MALEREIRRVGFDMEKVTKARTRSRSKLEHQFGTFDQQPSVSVDHWTSLKCNAHQTWALYAAIQNADAQLLRDLLVI